MKGEWGNKNFRIKQNMRNLNSLIVPENLKGGPLEFFIIHSVANYEKNQGALWRH